MAISVSLDTEPGPQSPRPVSDSDPISGEARGPQPAELPSLTQQEPDLSSRSTPTGAPESTESSLPTLEEMLAGRAKYEIHRVQDFSYSDLGGRSRLTADITTQEAEPSRVAEAMMRAAIEVQREGGVVPDVVHVRLWEDWPPPPQPTQEEFDAWSGEELEFYVRRNAPRKMICYARDGCGWGATCDGTTWDGVTIDEMPAWIPRVCPKIMEMPCEAWVLVL